MIWRKNNIFIFLLVLIVAQTACTSHERRMADQALHTADSLNALRQYPAPDTLLDAAIAHYGQRVIVPCEKLARAYYYRGRIERAAQNYPQAMEDFVQARRYFTRHTPPALQGRTAANIAFICTSQGSDSLALKYYNEALHWFEQAQDTSRIAYTLLDIGGIKLRAKHPDESLAYCREALPYAKDSVLYGYILQDMGLSYYKMQQLDSTFHYINQAIHYPCDNDNMSTRYLYLSYCHYDWENLESAAEYAQKALDNTNDPTIHKSAYYILMAWAKQMGDIDTHDLYSHNRTDAQNLIQNKQVDLTEAINKIPLELHERENIHLKTWLMWLLPLLLVITGYAVWKWTSYRTLKAIEKHTRRQHKRTIKKLRKQQALLTRTEEQLAKLIKRKEQRLHDFQEQKARLLEQKWKEWAEIERITDILLNGFFVQLQCKHPDLNEQGKRMCLLVLLNCSQQEMADLLFLSKNSIGSTKGRLAKNLGITAAEMPQYLMGFIGHN